MKYDRNLRASLLFASFRSSSSQFPSTLQVPCQPRNTSFCNIVNSFPCVASHLIELWSADNWPRRSSYASKKYSSSLSCRSSVWYKRLDLLQVGLHLFGSFRGTVHLRPVQHPWQIHAVKRSPGGPDVDADNQAWICAAYPNVTHCGLRSRALCGDATSLHLTKYLVLVECAIYFIFRKEPRHSTESAPSMERSCQVLHLLGTCCHYSCFLVMGYTDGQMAQILVLWLTQRPRPTILPGQLSSFLVSTAPCLRLPPIFQHFATHLSPQVCVTFFFDIHDGDTLHTIEVDPRPSVGRLPNGSRYVPGVPDGVGAPSQMSIMTALP